MPDYKLLNIKPAQLHSIEQGIHLIILNADRKPPHIMLTVGGYLYSLGVDGPMFDKPISSLWKYCIKNWVKTLFVELALHPVTSIDEIKSKARTIIDCYPSLDIGNATCLSPIKDFFYDVYQAPVSNSNFIFELLPKLEAKRLIKGSMQLNMENYITNNSFQLLKYGMEDINAHIAKARTLITQ